MGNKAVNRGAEKQGLSVEIREGTHMGCDSSTLLLTVIALLACIGPSWCFLPTPSCPHRRTVSGVGVRGNNYCQPSSFPPTVFALKHATKRNRKISPMCPPLRTVVPGMESLSTVPWKGVALLGATILLEVLGAMCMKMSNNFANLIPSVLLFVLYGSSFYLFTHALKYWPLSIAYAIWSGVGTMATAAIGIVIFGEVLKAKHFLGLVLIILGMVIDRNMRISLTGMVYANFISLLAPPDGLERGQPNNTKMRNLPGVSCSSVVMSAFTKRQVR
eukprot:752363-Hanusia_phi.AAC.8